MGLSVAGEYRGGFVAATRNLIRQRSGFVVATGRWVDNYNGYQSHPSRKDIPHAAHESPPAAQFAMDD